MRLNILWYVLLGLWAPAKAGDFPDWAYPTLQAHPASESPDLLAVPGSAQRFTQGHVDHGYHVADWYPDEHPVMPKVVAEGRQPPVRACAMCHLPNGAGHPESAGLAGLPFNYLVEQTKAFVAGERTGSRAASMVPISGGLTSEDIQASAEYFSSLTQGPWTRVVESDTVPLSRLGFGAVRYRHPAGGTEPLGRRIISLPENDELVARRDSHTGFVAHVPRGSIARGKELVEADRGRLSCAACHGEGLGGMGDVPGLRHRLPLVTFRALNDMKHGQRITPGSLAMKPSVVDLTRDDMIAISAYLGSLPP